MQILKENRSYDDDGYNKYGYNKKHLDKEGRHFDERFLSDAELVDGVRYFAYYSCPICPTSFWFDEWTYKDNPQPCHCGAFLFPHTKVTIKLCENHILQML